MSFVQRLSGCDRKNEKEPLSIVLHYFNFFSMLIISFKNKVGANENYALIKTLRQLFHPSN